MLYTNFHKDLAVELRPLLWDKD